MKNLANCKPSEFIKQTNRIRKSVEKWLGVTDVMNIRKRKPEIREGMTEEEIKKEVNNAISRNVSSILDSVMEDHPDETLEILALMCFVEPENVDDYTVADYLNSFNDLITNASVISFFTSLMRLGSTNTSDVRNV